MRANEKRPTRYVGRRSVAWWVVSFLVVALTSTASSDDGRYAIGAAVSNDPSKTPLILLQDNEANVEAAIAPAKGGEFERLSAVSLTGYKGDPFIVYRDPGGLAIRMSHSASKIPKPPVVLYNLWGDVAGGFFSPEPWVGLQNSLVLGQGLIRLRPGGVFEWTIRIEFERN